MLLAGCGDAEPATGSGVQPLAKVEGWRGDPQSSDEVQHGLVEIVADFDTAQQAWQGNVPDHLDDGDGSQGEPGVYGSLDDVDFTRQVVVVWHAGESGSCPGWLADIETEGQAVVIELDQYVPADACTDDYNPYRMVLAVDRDRLPEPGDLPTEDVVIDGIDNGRVATYPDESLVE